MKKLLVVLALLLMGCSKNDGVVLDKPVTDDVPPPDSEEVQVDSSVEVDAQVLEE